MFICILALTADAPRHTAVWRETVQVCLEIFKTENGFVESNRLIRRGRSLSYFLVIAYVFRVKKTDSQSVPLPKKVENQLSIYA